MRMRRRDRRLLASIHATALAQYRQGVLDSAHHKETPESLGESKLRRVFRDLTDETSWRSTAYNHGYVDQANGTVSRSDTLKASVWSDVYLSYLLNVASSWD